MKRGAVQGVEKYTREHQRKRRWYKLVTGLACMVVFCTVYALILPAITLERDTKNTPKQVGVTLDGDYAYISNVTIKSIVDGSAPFDTDDKNGNDSDPFNKRVRSFDTLSYTLNITNQVREGGEYKYYEEGRLYFEFVLPVSSSQAMFDSASMAWLSGKPGVTYEIIQNGEYNGHPAQFLRGSFLWQTTEGGAYAIGSGFVELNIYLRVLAMTEGNTLEPEFTFWLEGNEVGAEPEKGIPTKLVTDSSFSCPTQGHGKEYCTAKAETVTVTSAPRYNISLKAGNSAQQVLDTYDFDSGNNLAFNKGAGSVKGRLTCYGIVLQIHGKDKDHGMRGCEIPDGEPITFHLDISSVYTYNDAEGKKEFNSADNGYAPLIWSFDQNRSDGVQQDGRVLNGGDWNCNTSIPANNQNDGVCQDYQSCYDGGSWSGTLSGSTLSITVKNYEINLDQLPYGRICDEKANGYYYDPKTISGYWDVNLACFSAGELWVVQPFERSSDKKEVVDAYGSGSFNLTVEAKNLKMSGQSTPLPDSPTNENQMERDDDKCNIPVALERAGTINYEIAFSKTDRQDWNEGLAEGCFDNGKDWAVAGSYASIMDWMTHEAEGDERGIAYEQLVKFDSDYFIPFWTEPLESGVWIDGMQVKIGYGVVAETSGKGTPETGWDHTDVNGKKLKPNETGYDKAMIEATADDLLFFSSVWEVQARGYKCVGVLFEYHGCCTKVSLHADHRVNGDITTDQNLSGNVFMTTHSGSVWTKNDVRKEVAEYVRKSEDQLTDEDYRRYATEEFPSRIPTGYENEGRQLAYEGNYPAYPYNYWNYGVNGTDGAQNEGFKNYMKSQYSETGWIRGTSGTVFGDSCLLVAYTMEIEKSVTQNASDGTKKNTYSLDDGQRFADYQLTGSANIGVKNQDESSASEITTTVYIEDILPRGLSYVEGTSHYGGNYQQTAEGSQGFVTGGIKIEPEVVENTEDGTTTLRYKLEHVVLDLNRRTILPNIYYTCKIGDTINFQNDVNDGDELVNGVHIWSDEDKQRPFVQSNGNLSTCGIRISKLKLGNISKMADQPYVDVGDSMGFTMAVGNSGVNSRDIVALDILPYHGGGGTNFYKGSDCCSRVTGLALKKNTAGVDFDKLSVFYATDPSVRSEYGANYRNKTEAEILKQGWKKLTLDEVGTVSGFPDDWKPTAILVIGELGGTQTLGIHLTMQLTDGMPEDCVVNQLYESGDEHAGVLQAQARTYVVGRTLEGLTWLDANADGIQGETEVTGAGLLSGIKVSLWKLKTDGNPENESAYLPYCYPGTNIPIVIETGQKISVKASGAASAEDYKPGRYKFTELPAGIYAVKFTDGNGETKISQLIASPVCCGEDRTIDSDGTATYSQDRSTLLQTIILGIELPEAKNMQAALFEAKYNDSGFYARGVELPKTGGGGTIPCIVGGLLIICVSFLLWYRYRIRCRNRY